MLVQHVLVATTACVDVILVYAGGCYVEMSNKRISVYPGSQMPRRGAHWSTNERLVRVAVEMGLGGRPLVNDHECV